MQYIQTAALILKVHRAIMTNPGCTAQLCYKTHFSYYKLKNPPDFKTRTGIDEMQTKEFSCVCRCFIRLVRTGLFI